MLPENAVKCHPASLTDLFASFKFLPSVARLDATDMEWRKQAIEESDELDSQLSPLDFWRIRPSQRKVDGNLKYPNLRRMICCLMSLPFANAPVERLFSGVKLIKTDHRNSFQQESLVGLLHAKEGMNCQGKPADVLNLVVS